MISYINPNNEYPRYYGDIQIEHPEWKLGDALPTGWTGVYAATPPTAGEDEVVEEIFPTEIDGKMTQTFTTRPMTAEEIERRDAPKTAKAKLLALGLTEIEIQALIRGLVR